MWREGSFLNRSVYGVMMAKYGQTETLICYFPAPAGRVLKIIFFVCHMAADIDAANFLETNLIFVNWFEKT